MSEETSKPGKNKEPDIEFVVRAKMKEMHVVKAGKVEVSSYSNIKHNEIHESMRINLPDEIKDGETYKDAEIHSRRGNVIDEGEIRSKF
ncbi:MAG: hypothetical protein ACK4ND_13935 [Cytophagaceae bacterium]